VKKLQALNGLLKTENEILRRENEERKAAMTREQDISVEHPDPSESTSVLDSAAQLPLSPAEILNAPSQREQGTLDALIRLLMLVLLSATSLETTEWPTPRSKSSWPSSKRRRPALTKAGKEYSRASRRRSGRTDRQLTLRWKTLR
jgi:hypothetical protein